VAGVARGGANRDVLVDKPAWGGGAVPLWQLEQVAPPRLLWSTLAPVHLVKLAVFAAV